jgi:hypothetical protein
MPGSVSDRFSVRPAHRAVAVTLPAIDPISDDCRRRLSRWHIRRAGRRRRIWRAVGVEDVLGGMLPCSKEGRVLRHEVLVKGVFELKVAAMIYVTFVCEWPPNRWAVALMMRVRLLASTLTAEGPPRATVCACSDDRD